MNTQQINTPQFLLEAIKSEINKEVLREVEIAKKELERRTPEIVASISLQIMQMTSFQDLKDKIVFEIRKSPPNNQT